MKVLKFGGKSLANGEPLEQALRIICRQSTRGKIFVVLSARADATDLLEQMLEKAAASEDYSSLLTHFREYQLQPSAGIDLEIEISDIVRLLAGVAMLGEYSLKIKDQLLAYGEIISCKMVTHLLKEKGYKARFVDARSLIKTDLKFGSAQVIWSLSEDNFKHFFRDADPEEIEVVTGFIGSAINNQTTTLGRNGSNYTATLVAGFLGAGEVQNWTNVNGLYTANPRLVESARIIRHLSFREANELANFGTQVLHAKTILPLLERKIPIRILNSFNPDDPGTLIDDQGDGQGIKAISAIEDVALVSIEGRGLLGKVGIDGRIFSALSAANISVRIIAQASSERGIGFIIDREHAVAARNCLSEEFAKELELLDISSIQVDEEVAVISVISRNLQFLDLAYGSLNRNKIKPVLMTNTINGDHISLVVKAGDLKKAANIIHGHIFGVSRRLNVFLFGKGNVGKTLLQQLARSKNRIIERRGVDINIFGICDTKKLALDTRDHGEEWLHQLKMGKTSHSRDQIFQFIRENQLENVVLVDNTASRELALHYPDFISEGCDIVASNKHANTMDMSHYHKIRELLNSEGRQFFYETNVGAGLPLIDTIKLLHASGDTIYRIRGVFSGSLSYIFNRYSKENLPFHTVLEEAMHLALTEPDPREDLSGRDVARKLLILARELDMQVEMDDIEVESLVPEQLASIVSKEDFLANSAAVNAHFQAVRDTLKQDEVLRYTGELNVDNPRLEVKLQRVAAGSVLGTLSGSDSLFEIYTEAYGSHPLVIRGAGAGSEVTARGVFSDLLRLAASLA